MRCFKVVIFIILLLCGGKAATAQVDSSELLHFYLGKGLPANNVYSFINDKYGYLWFATENGVVKYNGYAFRVFNTNDGLPVNDVFRLYEDTMGRIWLHSFASTIGYIRNDKYTSIKYNFTEKYSTPYDIHQVGDKIVFGYGVRKGINIAMITPADRLVNIKYDKAIYSLYLSAEKEHYLHTIDNAGLYKVNINKGWFELKKVFNFRVNAQTLVMNRCFVANNSVFCYQFKGYSILKASLNTVNGAQAGFQKLLNIADIGGAKDEYIYLINCTIDGMIVYTKYSIYTLNYDFNVIDKISLNKFLPVNTQVSYMEKDKFNNDWLSSDFGVWMLPKTSGTFKAYMHSKALVNALPSGMLKDSTLTFRDKGAGMAYFIDKNNRLTIKDGLKDDIRYIQGNSINDMIIASLAQFRSYKNGVLSSYATPQKSLIRIGMPGEGMQYFPSHPHMHHPMTLGDSIKEYALHETVAFHEYEPNHFFNVGINYLYSITVNDTSVIQKLILNEKYTNLLYDTVTRKYLIYNRYKIVLYDPYAEDVKIFTEETLKKAGIRSIYSICLDKYRNLYILTDNKLLVYNVNNRTLEEINTNINLIGVKICIHKNRLILSGNFGVAVAKIIGPQSFSDFHYIYNPQNHNYNIVNYAQVISGSNLLIGTDQGTLSVDVDSILNNPHLGIGNGDSLMMMMMSAPYAKCLKNDDTLVLNEDVNGYTLDLINFLGKGDRKYYYRQKGAANWSESSLSEISTKDLKPGRYYHMQCYAMDDLWKTRVYDYYVYKQPYWWQATVWLIVFWTVGVIGLLALIFFTIYTTRYYVSKANEKKGKLLDLELRALYSQINPHFIFNALSAALFFINKKKFEEAYLHVSKFSRLLRSYLKSSQERYVTLSEEINMLRTYIELQQTRFEEKFDYNIKVENKIPADNVRIPSLLLQPLVENAIIHGLFHKQGKGFLKIQFLQGSTSDELICIIEDDGVGRIRASEIKRESAARYDSYGTKLTQQLIEIFKEYEHMHIYLEYIDKQKPETGTIVKLTLKNLKFNA